MTKIKPVATAHANGRIERHEVLGYAAGPEKLYTEAQMRQLGEACAKLVGLANSNMSQIDSAAEIRGLVKEMLG